MSCSAVSPLSPSAPDGREAAETAGGRLCDDLGSDGAKMSERCVGTSASMTGFGVHASKHVCGERIWTDHWTAHSPYLEVENPYKYLLGIYYLEAPWFVEESVGGLRATSFITSTSGGRCLDYSAFPPKQ